MFKSCLLYLSVDATGLFPPKSNNCCREPFLIDMCLCNYVRVFLGLNHGDLQGAPSHGRDVRVGAYMMFRLRVGGLERLEPPDELAPERLERRVPIEAGESPHLEDGVAEVPEQRQRAAVARAGLDLHPLHEADEVRVELPSEAASLATREVHVQLRILAEPDDRHRYRWCRGHGHGHGQQDRRPEGRALRLFDGLKLAHRRVFLCIVSSPPPPPENKSYGHVT